MMTFRALFLAPITSQCFYFQRSSVNFIYNEKREIGDSAELNSSKYKTQNTVNSSSDNLSYLLKLPYLCTLKTQDGKDY
jgi:hypothetical protein